MTTSTNFKKAAIFALFLNVISLYPMDLSRFDKKKDPFETESVISSENQPVMDTESSTAPSQQGTPKKGLWQTPPKRPRDQKNNQSDLSTAQSETSEPFESSSKKSRPTSSAPSSPASPETAGHGISGMSPGFGRMKITNGGPQPTGRTLDFTLDQAAGEREAEEAQRRALERSAHKYGINYGAQSSGAGPGLSGIMKISDPAGPKTQRTPKATPSVLATLTSDDITTTSPEIRNRLEQATTELTTDPAKGIRLLAELLKIMPASAIATEEQQEKLSVETLAKSVTDVPEIYYNAASGYTREFIALLSTAYSRIPADQRATALAQLPIPLVDLDHIFEPGTSGYHYAIEDTLARPAPRFTFETPQKEKPATETLRGLPSPTETISGTPKSVSSGEVTVALTTGENKPYAGFWTTTKPEKYKQTNEIVKDAQGNPILQRKYSSFFPRTNNPEQEIINEVKSAFLSNRIALIKNDRYHYKTTLLSRTNSGMVLEMNIGQTDQPNNAIQAQAYPILCYTDLVNAPNDSCTVNGKNFSREEYIEMAKQAASAQPAPIDEADNEETGQGNSWHALRYYIPADIPTDDSYIFDITQQVIASKGFTLPTLEAGDKIQKIRGILVRVPASAIPADIQNSPEFTKQKALRRSMLTIPEPLARPAPMFLFPFTMGPKTQGN